MSIARETGPRYEGMARALKVIADPRRLEILDLLMDGVQCNCEIGEHLEMAPNLISHHIAVLRKAGIVVTERDPVDSRWIYYSLNETALQELSREFGTFFDPSRIRPRRPDCGPASARS